jgi:hypothetical protein
MRTAAILATALAATVSATAAPTNHVTLTIPHLETPPDVAKFAQDWPDLPGFSLPGLKFQEPPKVEAPPEKVYPRLEPYSEEWRCLVPLKGTQRAPELTTITPNRCETPSIEPGNLLHLL